jgi:starvation-inducible DNA-binding protein
MRQSGRSQVRASSLNPVDAKIEGTAPIDPTTRISNQRTGTEWEPAGRREVGRMLNLLLADEYVFYKITRDYHWNVTGPNFFSLQLLFKLQHEAAAGWVDDLAERIRDLRLETRIGWTDLEASARCGAAPGFGQPAERMVAELFFLHDEMIAQLRADGDACLQRYPDADLTSFLTGLREQHENAASMLRSLFIDSGKKPSESVARFS